MRVLRPRQHVQAAVAPHPLQRDSHKTGDVWHARVDNIPRGHDGYLVRYGYLVRGDEPPRSHHDRWHPDQLPVAIRTRRSWTADAVDGDRLVAAREKSAADKSAQFDATPFDWEGDATPNLPPQDLIVYECTTRAFTADDSSALCPVAGVRSLPSPTRWIIWWALVNAVEFLRCFTSTRWSSSGRQTRAITCTTRGDTHDVFFAPMTPYASEGAGPPSMAAGV